MAIPMHERQGTMRALPDVAVRHAGDGGQGALWEKAKGFAGQLQAKVEEFEDAETLEAFNAFQREVEEYHNDPDKGIYNTRLGKDAPGVAGSADTHIDNLMFKYGGNLKSPRAKQVFGRMATQERERRYSANMQYESKQVQAFRDAEADATIQNSLTGIGLNPYDDAMVDAERDRAYMALELKMRGLGDEARVAAQQELDDRIAVARVAPMIQDDPLAARAWFEENKDMFSAPVREKVEAAITQEADKRIVVGATDQLWGQYGTDEAAARDAIYSSDLSDEQKDKTWTRYQARAQTDWYNQWYERLGQASSLEEAVAMIEQSGATGKHKIDLMDIAKQSFAGQGGGAKPEDDMGALLEAYEKIKRGELRDTKKLVQEYGPVLTKDTIETLSKQIIDGIIADEKSANGNDSDVDVIMQKAKITDPIEQARFQQVYFGEVMKAQQEKGSPLTKLERLTIAENLAKKDVVLQEHWYDDRKTTQYKDQAMKQIGGTWDPKKQQWVALDSDGNLIEVLTWESVDKYKPSGEPYDPTRVDREAMTPKAPAAAPGEAKKFEDLPPGAPPTKQYKEKPMTENQSKFIDSVAPAAQRVAASSGVMPSIILAQAALESGWGKSSIGNNLFGIKAGKNWKGATKSVGTHEYEGGKRVNVTAAFRDYGSIDESIADHSKLLQNKRYSAVRAAGNYREAAQALQAAGYATDPKYAQKLIQIIEQYGLDQYDAA